MGEIILIISETDMGKYKEGKRPIEEALSMKVDYPSAPSATGDELLQ